MNDRFSTNMKLVKEGKLVCKQKKCKFYKNCDNYICNCLEIVNKELLDERD